MHPPPPFKNNKASPLNWAAKRRTSINAQWLNTTDGTCVNFPFQLPKKRMVLAWTFDPTVNILWLSDLIGRFVASYDIGMLNDSCC